MGAPDQHFESMKETSKKLDQAENQLLAAEAESKKLLIANKEASDHLQAAEAEKKQLLIAHEKSIKEATDKQLQAEKKLQDIESEMKRILIAKEEATEKLIKAENAIQ